tara:strand:+ start:1013 stop:4006 length:2994 start_codon:yes stop_codon:yes gene_type:complete
MFVHLNIHSVYSAMKGLIPLSEIINQAKEYSMNTLALTDINGIWGFIRFVQHCKDSGIKPIAGTNLITEKQEILILVENQHGYDNLCRIISAIHDNPKKNITSIVKKYHSGLFILSYDESILKVLQHFIPDTHLFIELRPGVQESTINRLANKLKLDVIATGDVYFMKKIDHRFHMILRAVDCNTTFEKLKKLEYKSEHHWFRNEKEMIRIFPNSLEALNNSKYLAERCKTDWSFINTVFPGLSLKKTYHANKQLKNEVYKGARKRYGFIDGQIRSRIQYELAVINQKGFAPYFIIVKDIVDKSRATIGRGSAAASIVSYCLFITQVDPLKYRLYFERFIHPEREDMPDIDIDFPWDERDEILNYVFNKYGKDRTAMVANHVFLRPRSAIREVGKVYGLSNEEIKSITKRIGWHSSYQNMKYWIHNDPRFSNVELDETIDKVLKDSEKIIGVLHHLSVHPGGMIIVPDEIRKYVPVLRTPKGVQIVEWEKDQVEDSGLLKIDILGNRSLSVVRDTIRHVNFNDYVLQKKYLNYHEIHSVTDEKTRELISRGKTMGVFYIESPASRQLLAKAGMVDFEHVVIYSSIIRPAANRYIDLMLSRIHGGDWKLIHPDLHFLRESYGIIVYEEQVSMTVMTMAGLSYSEAEALRKSINRSSMKHMISSWEERFTRKALDRGYSKTIISEVWSMIVSFVGYSFCKPHSASYAMLSFTCAYLKAHFPAEFLAAVISNQGGYYSSYAYMSEARRFGIRILHPDINNSHHSWFGKKDQIQMGFMSIKKLQKKTIELIIDERKAGYFDSLNDFLFRVNLDLSDAMSLTNAGCFKSIAPKMSHQQVAYKIAGFYLQNGSRKLFSSSPFVNDITEDERYHLELDSFGFPISTHPIARYRSMLSDRIKYAKDIHHYFKKSIYLLGMYITKKEIMTRNSQPMEFLTLEDETDIYECVLFPKVFQEFGDLFQWESSFIIRGIIEKSFGVCIVKIEKVASLQKWVHRINQAHAL